jgi:hypothetical protein
MTRRGQSVALLAPLQPERSLKQVCAEIAKIRKRSRLPQGVAIKNMVEEAGRQSIVFAVAPRSLPE